MLAGYTVVDPSTVIATHLTEVFKRNLHEFLGRQETQQLLDQLSQRAPKAVEDLVPGIMQLGNVQKVLQNLVKEGVSIRDLLTVVEALADYGQAVKDPDQLTEYVRSRMGRTIIKPHLAQDGTLPIITLDPSIEGMLQDNLRQTDQGAYLALEPAKAQQIIQSINRVTETAMATDGQPILLTSPMVRPHLAQIVIRFIPTLPVVSQAEIPADVRLQTLAVVDLKNAG
jgi:flagellar biosynthesis protein FlhA